MKGTFASEFFTAPAVHSGACVIGYGLTHVWKVCWAWHTLDSHRSMMQVYLTSNILDNLAAVTFCGLSRSSWLANHEYSKPASPRLTNNAKHSTTISYEFVNVGWSLTRSHSYLDCHSRILLPKKNFLLDKHSFYYPKNLMASSLSSSSLQLSSHRSRAQNAHIFSRTDS